MSNLNQAVNDVKSFANKFKSIIEVGEVLENLANLDNAAKEMEARKVKAKEQFKESAQKLLDIGKDIQSKKDELKILNAQSESIISNASTEANSIISNAKSKADEIIKNAGAKKFETEKEVGAMKNTLKELDKDISLKRQELENLQGTIEKTKQKIASL